MVGLDDPILLLDTNTIHVDPGAEARVTVTVYNPTTIVEEYAVEVLGTAAAWSTVEPARLAVMPGDHVTATVVLHPPRYPAPPAGTTAFAVRCASQLNRANAAVMEADVVVGGFQELAVQVAPTMSKGIRRGKHRILVVNRGNLATRVRLAATESGDELTFKFRPQVLDVPGPGQVQSRLKAKAQTTFLKGSPEHHRFELWHGPVSPGLDEVERQPTPLTFVQKPWLSGPLVALFALLVLAGVLLGVLLSLRDEPGSDVIKRTLEVPELTTVEASGVSSVRLAWTRVDGARQYVIQLIAGASTGTPSVADEQPVAAEAETFTVPGLPPATEFCFRLVADTDAGRSEPSETKCATTAELAPFLPPSGLFVTPVAGTTNVQLAWTPSAPGASHVVFVDGETVTQVTGDRVQLDVEPGERCFAVAGLADNGAQTEADGPRCLTVTDPAATTTVAPTTTVVPTTTTVPPTTGPPTTEPDSGSTTTIDDRDDDGDIVPPATVDLDPGFVAVVDVEQAADLSEPEPLDRARDREEEFKDAGLEVELASTTAIGVSGPQSWLLFVDGIDTQQQADQLCEALTDRDLIDAGEQCVVLENER